MLEDVDWDLLSSYAGLLGLATISIYAGSHGSLPNPRLRKAENASGELTEEDFHVDAERLSSDDAWLFPLIGSATLFGLYVAVKHLGKDWINWFLGWYFSIAGIGSVWKSTVSLFRWLIGKERWKSFHHFTFIIQKDKKPTLSLSCRTPTLILLPLAFVLPLLHIIGLTSSKSVLMTDILSLSFSHNALSLLKIDSFKTGSILLGGLFFYDVWWVFGTEVMVKVATSLDAPIKILWPKSLSLASERGHTMLGLGDIVVPGIFIALALRYDYHRHLSGSAGQEVVKFSKPYFCSSLLAYVLGLATTMTVMHVFHAAQPALLYLSPACILSFVATASLRGEFKEVWSWSDVPEDDDKGSIDPGQTTKHEIATKASTEDGQREKTSALNNATAT